jgi:NADP-dependent 3-hydroxy acid dehydrogenase YdfG
VSTHIIIINNEKVILVVTELVRSGNWKSNCSQINSGRKYRFMGAARRVESMKRVKRRKSRHQNGRNCSRDVKKLYVAQVIKEQGKIDVLVNNAGYAIYGSGRNFY